MTKYTNEEWKVMLNEAKEKGLTRRRVSCKYDISISQVTRMCKVFGISLPRSNLQQGYRKKVTAEEHDGMRRDYENGISVAQICDKYNVSSVTARNHLNMKKQTFLAQRMKERLDRYHAGMTARQMAEAENVAPEAIRAWLHLKGLPINTKFTDGWLQRRIDRYHAGMTVEQMADAEGVKISTIRCWIYKNHLTTVPEKREKVEHVQEKNIGRTA